MTNIIRGIRRTGDMTQMGEKRNVYRLLVGKPDGDHCEDQDVDCLITLR
jgi:hypothetical protein